MQNARQIRLTVGALNPLSLAIERVLQCVASRGSDSRVFTTTRSTSPSPIVRGAPGRGSSSNHRENRDRSASTRRWGRRSGRHPVPAVGGRDLPVRYGAEGHVQHEAASRPIPGAKGSLVHGLTGSARVSTTTRIFSRGRLSLMSRSSAALATTRPGRSARRWCRARPSGSFGRLPMRGSPRTRSSIRTITAPTTGYQIVTPCGTRLASTCRIRRTSTGWNRSWSMMKRGYMGTYHTV